MSETSQMTLAVEAIHEMENLSCQVSRMWLDDQELVTVGLTIDALFSHLNQQGWSLSHMRVSPGKGVNRWVFFYSKRFTPCM